MRGHKIHFCSEIRKIIFKLSPLPLLIWSSCFSEWLKPPHGFVFILIFMFVVIGIQEIYNKKKIPPITREEYNRGIAEAILETEPVSATSLSTVA